MHFSLTSSLLCSAIGFYCSGWGTPPSRAPTLASHCLPRVLAESSAHLTRVHPLLPCALLASLVNLDSFGGPVVIEDTPGVSLTVSPLLRNGIGITE